MKITKNQWAQLKAAVAADDKEAFGKTLQELARIAVAHERSHAIRCDAARSREQGNQTYAVWER
jgi:inactivated superfamily I helicase